MEAFVTPEPDHLKGLTVQPAECNVFEDALAVPGSVGQVTSSRAWAAPQARALRSQCAEVVDLAELLAET